MGVAKSWMVAVVMEKAGGVLVQNLLDSNAANLCRYTTFVSVKSSSERYAYLR